MAIEFSLSKARVVHVFKAQSLAEATAIKNVSDLIDHIIDWFKGGIKRAEIEQLFDELNLMKKEDNNEDRLFRFYKLQTLIKERYQYNFKIEIIQDSNKNGKDNWQYKLCIENEAIFTSEYFEKANVSLSNCCLETQFLMELPNIATQSEYNGEDIKNFSHMADIYFAAGKQNFADQKDQRIWQDPTPTDHTGLAMNGQAQDFFKVHTNEKSSINWGSVSTVHAPGYQFSFSSMKSGSILIKSPYLNQILSLDGRILFNKDMKSGDVRTRVKNLVYKITGDAWNESQKKLFFQAQHEMWKISRSVDMLFLRSANPIKDMPLLKIITDRLRKDPLLKQEAFNKAVAKVLKNTSLSQQEMESVRDIFLDKQFQF